MTISEVTKNVVAFSTGAGSFTHVVPTVLDNDFELLFYVIASAIKVPTQTAGNTFDYLGNTNQSGSSIHTFKRKLLAADSGTSITHRWNDTTSGGALNTIKCLTGYVVVRGTLPDNEIDVAPAATVTAASTTKVTPAATAGYAGDFEVAVGYQTTAAVVPSTTPWTTEAGLTGVSGQNTGSSAMNSMVVATKTATLAAAEVGGTRTLTAPQSAIGGSLTYLLRQLVSGGGGGGAAGPGKANGTIFAELVAAGYTTGTIADREYARLKALTGSSGVGMSMHDLYRLAGERPRL